VTALAPGSFTPSDDRVGEFPRALDRGAFVVADARVLALHPKVARAVSRVAHVALTAGEPAKSLRTVERLAIAALDVPRSATIIAIGGGTIGDVATVFAHLHKRGARLIHVPTTWLAAIDSSVGGKGAVNVKGRKNALGVFHAAAESWLCPELFTTLTATQRVEGEAEAFKMALTLDPTVWRTWRLARPDDASLIRTSRALKNAVCVADPYEHTGARAVLNFGHTFAHVIESLTNYRVRHGVAVALGMVCALDLSRALGATRSLDVDRHLPLADSARARLQQVFASATVSELKALLVSDKKGASKTHTRFVLFNEPGQTELRDVPHIAWTPLLRAWARGAQP
jgi:3-dehydroquinate synthase